jgi:Mg/Co/Ni transporter MgtE
MLSSPDFDRGEMNPNEIAAEVALLAPPEAAAHLAPFTAAEVAAVLRALNPAVADDILLALGDQRRRGVIAAALPDEARQWAKNLTYPENAVGRLMEPAQAVFPPDLTVAETVSRIRELVKTTFVTYGFVTDEAGVSSPCATCCWPSASSGSSA